LSSGSVDNSAIELLRVALEQKFGNSASKIICSGANLIDRNGVWRVKVGRYGVKWFTGP
jgi:hypothetical protein